MKFRGIQNEKGLMKSLLACLFLILSMSACSKKSDNTDLFFSDEIAQNAGDMMAGIDESGGSSGTLAYQGEFKNAERILAQNSKDDLRWQNLISILVPKAQAVSCYAYGFSACSSNSITRTFNNCSMGLSTISGSVFVGWDGSSANCTLGTTNDTITRIPSFVITGPSGGTFNVSKTSVYAQRMTWVSGTGSSKVFSYYNDGIRRWVKTAGGATVYDYTTTTTSNISVTGTTRSNRVINGGTLRVTNNISGVTCDITPTNLAWSTGCTCASSGSWSGSCSDGTSVNLSIGSCGTGTLSLGTSSMGVTFDRCMGT
jgi:hypothetical protein